MHPRLALVLCLASACGACAEAPGPFSAPSGPRRVVWQQFCEQAWNVPQASALVAARGADGWELIAMYNGALCYKRPTADANPARPVGSPTPAGAYVPAVRDPGF
jgi:hypothetical protein